MLLNNTRTMGLGKDGLSNSVGDVVPNISPLQAGSPLMPRGDTDMLMKVLLFLQSLLLPLFLLNGNFKFPFFC